MEKFIAKIRDARSRETPCPLPNIQLICHTILRQTSIRNVCRDVREYVNLRD